MTIEQHIEELRAELRNAPTMEERRQIEAELDAAVEALDEKDLPD
jgi:F0F1-type ATP synthase epsilon subunit